MNINLNETFIIPHSNEIKECNYQLLQQNCIKQQESCYALAFNNDSSILIAGSHSKIRIYKLINEELKEQQIVSEHKDDVSCLQFMKNSNHFISGSKDQSIIIWAIDSNNQWFCKQRLNDHTERITCLIIVNNDDLLISSSWDKSIKFYNKTDQWDILQTVTEHTEQVWSISLNPSQNKLITCGNDRTILVLEQKNKQINWIVVQRINLEVRGYRICFINENTFAFQPWISKLMNIYQFDENTNLFQKKKDVKVSSGNSCDYLSPLLYISNQSLIVNKNGFHINFIRKYQEEDYLTELSIPFDTNYIYLSISRDGQYLATWDNLTQQIQIRKCY
ncbi:unnamed protein product [Paramecium sonneborni]|uniref:WD40 repeat-containing protein n=1 Tax=Paramecium sonneborni TaxID=65129 RepID=A0A8S1REK4_9CILI|nr:unnamed protein product [Paramecium sonneborni]